MRIRKEWRKKQRLKANKRTEKKNHFRWQREEKTVTHLHSFTRQIWDGDCKWCVHTWLIVHWCIKLVGTHLLLLVLLLILFKRQDKSRKKTILIILSMESYVEFVTHSNRMENKRPRRDCTSLFIWHRLITRFCSFFLSIFSSK